MNICFLIGKVISDIKFEFILDKNKISAAIFEIELKDKNIVELEGYNEIADICYQKLQKNKWVCIQGIVTEEKIEIEEIYIYNE